MVEKDLIINNRQIKYQGLFKYSELFNVINDALIDKGYTRNEKKFEETINEQGKMLYLELRPTKIKTKYMTLKIKIKVNLLNITEKVQNINNHKDLYQNGSILIAFDSWLITDMEQRWEMKPFYYFMKGLISKWFYPIDTISNFRNEILGDTAHIYGSIKGLLAKYRKKDSTYVKEEEVIEQVRKEIDEMLHDSKVEDINADDS